jgi:hypothetical protein
LQVHGHTLQLPAVRHPTRGRGDAEWRRTSGLTLRPSGC